MFECRRRSAHYINQHELNDLVLKEQGSVHLPQSSVHETSSSAHSDNKRTDMILGVFQAQQGNTKASFAVDKVGNSSSHLMMHRLQIKPTPTAKMRMINTLELVQGLQGNESSCRSLHYTCQHKLISRRLKAMHQHSHWPYSITRHHKHANSNLTGWLRISKKSARREQMRFPEPFEPPAKKTKPDINDVAVNA
jgi:hypothetical protein